MKDVDEEEEDEDEIASDLDPEEGTYPFRFQVYFAFLYLQKMKKRTVTMREKTKMHHSRLWVAIVILNLWSDTRATDHMLCGEIILECLITTVKTTL